MAKKTATKKPAEKGQSKKAERTKEEVIDPKRIHELLGLPGPYDPPKAPPRPGAVTFWDCGMSINEMHRRHPELFLNAKCLAGERFAKDSDSWKWRQLNPTPLGLGEPFEEQRTKVPKDDEIPAARELVCYLIVHFLVTGERLEIPRLRCRDVMQSGRRVVVGPFRESGLEIANVSDLWKSPGIGLCSIFTPPVPRRK